MLKRLFLLAGVALALVTAVSADIPTPALRSLSGDPGLAR